MADYKLLIIVNTEAGTHGRNAKKYNEPQPSLERNYHGF